jgi:hypothetical protein
MMYDLLFNYRLRPQIVYAHALNACLYRIDDMTDYNNSQRLL